ALEINNLVKTYKDGTQALKGVDLQVESGEIFALLGPNGAGKSTCLKMLTGYLASSSGSARLAGFDAHTERLQLSRVLGYLPENGPLYEDMTPLSFLRFIAQVRGLTKDQEQQALQRVAESCQLAEVWNKSIKKLSKGFRQRVGLAQAILHKPQILILDEPTAGLDPNQIVVVRQLIDELRASCTILLSTHILQEVEAMADHVLLISEGRLRFNGSMKEMELKGSLSDEFYALTNKQASA
ncbi:MAG: ABC transporter ATP-binding protein, partial [Planctomycetes bacterium]|nr:ABC transporter ATP-binding protein [Planctomycetota bacterium]